MTIIHFITTDRDIHLGEIIRSLRNFKSCLDRQQLLQKTWRKDTDLSNQPPIRSTSLLKGASLHTRITYRPKPLNHRVIFLIFILSFADVSIYPRKDIAYELFRKNFQKYKLSLNNIHTLLSWSLILCFVSLFPRKVRFSWMYACNLYRWAIWYR